MSSNYTGNPAATQAPSPPPDDQVEPIVVLPSDGDTLNAASVTQAFKVLADYSAWLTNNSTARQFGDGVNGSFSLPAVTTMAFDLYFDDLTIGATSLLFTHGLRLFCSGTLTVDGFINAGSGVAYSPGSIAGMVAGGAGGANANGSVGTGVISSDGGDGGVGGDCLPKTGGAGGTAIAPVAGYGDVHWPFPHMTGHYIGGGAVTMIFGGGAGGGGGALVGSTGGNGGSGGGVIVICAKKIIVNFGGEISARGAPGAAGTGPNAGGGGGGGGGTVMLFYRTLINNGTIVATSGSGGAATGTGVAGSPGSNGHVRLYQV